MNESTRHVLRTCITQLTDNITELKHQRDNAINQLIQAEHDLDTALAAHAALTANHS